MDFFIPLIVYELLVSILFRKKRWLLFALTFVPLLLFWGTKVDFGPDYAAYLYKYEMHHDMPISLLLMEFMEGKFEPGFFFLMKILPSFDSLVFVTATFLILSVLIFLDEFLPKYSLPLALFLWLFNSSIFNTFSAMRSSFVIGFFLLAIIAKTRSKNKTSVCLMLIGAQFHLSGYLLVLLSLLPRDFQIKKHNSLTVILLLFIIFSLFLPTFFSSIIGSALESATVASYYDSYIKETGYGLGFYFFSFIRVGFIFYILSLLKRSLIEEKYVWIAWLTIIYYLLMMLQNVEIMYRFFNYFFLITVVFKCYVLKVDKTGGSVVYVGLSIIYALYNFYGYMHNTELMPYYEHYHSFLFK